MGAVALLVACGGGEEADPGSGHYAGGVLTGLKAGNSVLISSGPQSVTLSADGTYRFGRFPSGTVYNITATSASDTQRCTVVNGSGQIQDSDIDNIAVNCADVYSVGGTLSGYLPGDGPVSLLLNGSETLALSANGSFTFSERLAPGDGYVVSLGSVPSSLLCSIAAGTGSGVLGSANVTGVAVNCEQASGTVSFTVSGLSAPDSLTVQLGGSGINSLPATSRQVALSDNGSYSFATPVPVGSTYGVALAALPANHSCVVLNGAGTFALPGVNNVRIECQRNTYSIGGTIGLFAGERAVIALYDGQENQIDTVEVSRAPTNATFNSAVPVPFTFTPRVDNGFSYYATVIVYPPGDPQYDEKNCTGSNFSGTVAGSDVTNIEFTCGYF